MNRRTLELWVGLFVAAGLAALALLAFKVGNLGSADVNNAYSVTARFTDIGGLKVKSPVTIAGVRIGRVSAIDFDPTRFTAVVTMKIDGRYDKIPSDTTASILTSGLLGEQYIGLEPGIAEDHLAQGGTIDFTQPAMVLEKMVGRFLLGVLEEHK